MALGHAMAHDNHVSPMAEAPLKMTQHVEIDAIDINRCNFWQDDCGVASG